MPSAGPRRSATSPGWPARSAASASTTRRSTASTSRSRRHRSDRRVRRTWTAILTTRADAADDQTSRGGYDREALLVERARLLRRLGRHDEALATWRDLGLGGGPWAGVGWVEVAKILEHRRADPTGALEACTRADRIAERSRLLGRRLPQLEADLVRRRRRLARRIASGGVGSAGLRSRRGSGRDRPVVPGARLGASAAGSVGA